MGLFRQLHKSAFWSQFLFGMFAILALPIPQTPSPVASTNNEAEQNTIQQTLTLSELVANQQAENEQVYFLFQSPFAFQYVVKQAVVFCKFFAKSYRLESVINPPIRAGPVV